MRESRRITVSGLVKSLGLRLPGAYKKILSSRCQQERVSRSLFQVGARTPVQVAMSSHAESAAQDRDKKEETSHRKETEQEQHDDNRGADGFHKFISTELVDSIKDMHVECSSSKLNWLGEKERVFWQKHDDG
jgi:hypothetical protein